MEELNHLSPLSGMNITGSTLETEDKVDEKAPAVRSFFDLNLLPHLRWHPNKSLLEHWDSYAHDKCNGSSDNC